MSARMKGVENSVENEKVQEDVGVLRQWQAEELLEFLHVPPFMIHVGLVLFIGWLASIWKLNLLFIFTLGFAYLWHIENRQKQKIEHRIRSEERKATDRKRSLSDTETARWLNNVVKCVWPIFMEKFASEHLMMRLAPWFLAKYKPWTASKVVLQKLCLGKSPPVFQFLRVGRHPSDGDHLLLEMTVNFTAARDMSAVMAVQMRKRLAGLWTSFHISGLQLEGKVRIGVRFTNGWPVISRLRICFSDAPVLRMVATPVFSRGVDVTDLPGIASWLDKMIIDALEQSLVEPNLLVIDVEKLVGDLMSVNAKLQLGKNLSSNSSKAAGDWFHVGQTGAVATLLIEIIEAEHLKPSDSNGKADPYVKIGMGKTEMQTSIKKKTLSPNWHEEFRLPIMSWASPPFLTLHVRDKDRFIDDWLGHKQVNVEDYRNGERHDMWLPLEGVKTGKLHVAFTVVETEPLGEIENKSHGSPDFEDTRKGGSSPPVSHREVHDRSLPRSLPRSDSNGELLLSEDSDETPVKNESEPVDVGVGESGCVSIVTPGRDVVEEPCSSERLRQRNRSGKKIAEKEKRPGKSSSREDESDHVQHSSTSPGEGSVRRKHIVRSFLHGNRSQNEEKKDNRGEHVSGELSQEVHELMIVGETGSQVHMKLELNDEDVENLEDSGLQDELPIVPESGDLQGCNVDGLEKSEKSSWRRSGMKLGKGVWKQAGKAAHGIGNSLPMSSSS